MKYGQFVFVVNGVFLVSFSFKVKCSCYILLLSECNICLTLQIVSTNLDPFACKQSVIHCLAVFVLWVGNAAGPQLKEASDVILSLIIALVWVLLPWQACKKEAMLIFWSRICGKPLNNWYLGLEINCISDQIDEIQVKNWKYIWIKISCFCHKYLTGSALNTTASYWCCCFCYFTYTYP